LDIVNCTGWGDSQLFISENGFFMIKKIIGITLFVSSITISYAQAPAPWPPWHQPPPGNYSESCGSATGDYYYPFDGTTLQMWCATTIVIRPGVVTNSSVFSSFPNATNCRYVENINGVLTCTGGWK
jgi:hypothetical protein